MNKIWMALPLSVLTWSAQAEVVLYGQIRAGYEANSVKTDDVIINGDIVSQSTHSPMTNGVVDRVSRMGFKGYENLGNGLKAIWQIEQNTPIIGSNSQWATRDAFVGLQGDFGTVKAGRLSNYTFNHGFKADPWIYNKKASNSALGLFMLTRTDARYVGVGYDSPNWSGLSFGLLFSPRDNNNNNDRQNDEGIGTRAKYSAGVSYVHSGLQFKYGVDYLKNNAGQNLDGQFHRLESVYDANNLFLALAYQYSKNIVSYNNFIQNYTKAVSGHEVALSAGYHVGSWFPKVSYGHGWDVKTTASGSAKDGVGNIYSFEKGDKIGNSKYDQIIVGTDYNFSKRTIGTLQAGWLRQGALSVDREHGASYNGGKSTITAFGLGLQHIF